MKKITAIACTAALLFQAGCATPRAMRARATTKRERLEQSLWTARRELETMEHVVLDGARRAWLRVLAPTGLAIAAGTGSRPPCR